MYIGDRGRSKRRGPVQWLGIAFVVLVAAAVLVVALLWWYAGRQLQSIELAALGGTGTQAPTDADTTDVLVVIGDGLHGPDEAQRTAPQTVSQVVHVQLSEQRVGPVAVAFPMDLRVTMPGQGPALLGDVLEQGGPDALLTAMQDFTGVPIDHYVAVDLAGVSRITDTLGGIEVCLDEPFRDAGRGLDLSAGCHDLDGRRADAFVRSDAPSDEFGGDEFGQIARRAAWLQAAAARASAPATLANPFTLRQLLRAVGDTIVTDHPAGLLRFQRTSAEIAASADTTLITRTVPGTLQTVDGQTLIIAAPEQAPALFDLLRQGAPLDAELGTEPANVLGPRNVSVLVVNGVGIAGLAGDMREFLEVRDFPVVDAVNPQDLDPQDGWDTDLVRLTIRHTEETLPHAQVLRDHLGDVPVDLELIDEGDLPPDTSVVLVVGSAWAERA